MVDETPQEEPPTSDAGREGFFGRSTEQISTFISRLGDANKKFDTFKKNLKDSAVPQTEKFTTSVHDLNVELEETIRLLEESAEKMKDLPEGVGSGSKIRNGGDVTMPDRERIAEEHSRDTGIPRPGTEGGAGAGGPTGFQRVMAGAAATAGVASAIGVPLLSSFRERAGPASYLQMQALDQEILGTGTWQDTQNLFQRGQGGFGSMEELTQAHQALAAGGILPGTDVARRVESGVSDVFHARPDADAGTMASHAAALEFGPIGMGLRQRGITTAGDDYPTAMRNIIRSAFGGDPSRDQISTAVPGSPPYRNLLALLGNDPLMVNEVLQFAARDAQGRAKGVDVTTEQGALEAGIGTTEAAQRRRREGQEVVRGLFGDEEGDPRFEGIAESETGRHGRRADSSLRDWIAENLGPIGDRLGGIASNLADSFQEIAITGAAVLYMFKQLPAGIKTALTAPLKALAGSTLGTRVGLAGLAASSGARAVGGRALGIAAGPAGWAATAMMVGASVSDRALESESRVVRAAGQGLRKAAPGVEGAQVFDDLLFSGSEREEDEGRWAYARRRSRERDEAALRGWVEPAGGLSPNMDPDMVAGADHEGEGYSERGFGGVRTHVARAGHYIDQMFGPFPGGIGGKGARPGRPTSDHPQGLALDFMTNSNLRLGDRVVNYLSRKAQHFGVKYIIWKQHINSGDGRGWRKMGDRGSPTANHMDHPHVSFMEHATTGGRSFEPFTENEDARTDTGSDQQFDAVAASTTASTLSGFGSQEEIDVFNQFFGGGGGEAVRGRHGASIGTGDADSAAARPNVSSEGTLSDTEIARLARYGGWQGSELVTAVAIALAESRGNPSTRGDIDLTTSGELSKGLWQIHYRPGRDENNPTRDPQANADPTTNARNAYQIYRQQGWGAWSVHPNSSGYTPRNSYSNFLDRARDAVGSMQTTSAHTEPAGGLDSSPVSIRSGGSAPISPAPMTMSSAGGSTNVRLDVNFNIERATYDEAEKFAGWVMDVINQRDEVRKVGIR